MIEVKARAKPSETQMAPSNDKKIHLFKPIPGVRNKKNLLQRKSLYKELQSQIEQLENANKESKGTIETLSRQLVQAGIKMKVGEQAVETRKETLETKAQQKLYRNIMKKDFNAYEKAKKENSGNDK